MLLVPENIEILGKSKGSTHPRRPRGQLVGATGFSRAKVNNKNGRAPEHLLLSTKFQKGLKSRLLIGQRNFSDQVASGISKASGTRSIRVNAQGLSRSYCKLSPVKILSPQLAAPGSPRLDWSIYCVI